MSLASINPPAPVRDLPPSCKLVYLVLACHEDPLTVQGLCEETMLAHRTTRYAIERLEEEDAITSRPNPTDARQRLYTCTLPEE